MGKTENPPQIKPTDYRLDIKKTPTEKPVVTHFNSVSHSMEDLQIMNIEKSIGRMWHIEEGRRAT